MSDKCYLIIDRDNGTRTFKGPWVHAHVMREHAAWSFAFPAYVLRVAAAPDVKADARAWAKATKDGGKYYPDDHIRRFT